LAYTLVRQIVAQGFDVPESDFLERTHQRAFAWPRFGLVFWVRVYCKEPGVTSTGRALPMSFPAIAKRLGNMDHTSIVNADQRARELWRDPSDGPFAAKMDRCWASFQEAVHVG
jgi:chromosomal replication initiation ATPase DnaA